MRQPHARRDGNRQLMIGGLVLAVPWWAHQRPCHGYGIGPGTWAAIPGGYALAVCRTRLGQQHFVDGLHMRRAAGRKSGRPVPACGGCERRNSRRCCISVEACSPRADRRPSLPLGDADEARRSGSSGASSAGRSRSGSTVGRTARRSAPWTTDMTNDPCPRPRLVPALTDSDTMKVRRLNPLNVRSRVETA